MIDEDVFKFITLMNGIGEIYGKNISETLSDIYWKILMKYDLEDVKNAFECHVKCADDGKFFPKPGDIIRRIEGAGETRALQAWAKVEGAINSVGRYQSLAFDDVLIHAVLEDMGGWVRLCENTYDTLPFYANEFRKRYMGFVNKKPTRHLKYLPGICETDNNKNGYPIAPPLLIGNAKQAEQVINSGGGVRLEINDFSAVGNMLIEKLSENNS